METGEHRLLLTFQPLNIFVNQFLPFFDQYALSHRIWSPDSNAIVLPVLEKEQAKVLVIPTQSYKQKPIHIADGLMAFWSRQ
jgi:TolB protein